MTIPTTSPDDLRRHLTDLGLAAGAHVAIHSRLLAFGRITGGVEAIHDAISGIIGPEGTIVVPAYTLAADTIYDPDTTASQNVGAYSEFILARPGRIRSICPMHNHAGIGTSAPVLAQGDGTVSFGPGSDFDYMLEADFQLLLLGTGLNEGASFIHHIEAVADVPYRKWITLQRQRTDGHGALVTTTCRYFGRQPGSPIVDNFDILEPELLAAGKMTRVDTHFGASRLVRLRDLFDLGLTTLRRDPFGMVKVS